MPNTSLRSYQYVDEKGNAAQITTDEYTFEGVKIFSATSRQETTIKLKDQQDIPELNLFFSLQGDCSAHHHKREGDYPITDMQHTVCYIPEFDGHYTLDSPEVNNFGVIFYQSFLDRLFMNDIEHLQRFWEQVHANKIVNLTPSAMPVTPAQLSVIRDIQRCRYTGSMQQLFYESKIIELFLLQVEQAGKLNGKQPVSYIHKRDTEKLYAVRDYLNDHMFEPLTLAQIARHGGLNDFKLKRGFKELFGNTVFGYLNELKMNHGKQLLTDTCCTVYEAAYMLGYADPHSFTKAFKKHFGYLPGKMKRG